MELSKEKELGKEWSPISREFANALAALKPTEMLELIDPNSKRIYRIVLKTPLTYFVENEIWWRAVYY
jgi:hypothetical protein